MHAVIPTPPTFVAGVGRHVIFRTRAESRRPCRMSQPGRFVTIVTGRTRPFSVVRHRAELLSHMESTAAIRQSIGAEGYSAKELPAPRRYLRVSASPTRECHVIVA
jgi:hypothetical protein